MGTFSFEKPIEDIEDPQLMEEGWAKVKIVNEPKLGVNDTAKKHGIKLVAQALNSDEEGVGVSLMLKLQVQSDDPELQGRELVTWLSWPNKRDEQTRNRDGQKWSDWKMSQIVAFTEAFGGFVSGKDVEISQGLRGQVYVLQKAKRDNSGFENIVDNFAGFRSFEAEEGVEEVFDTSGADDDEAF